ncbi:MAG: nucleoside triphosphate pyrophosphatase [Pseudomonadota bacterium]
MTSKSKKLPLILASGSRYRAELLKRLGLPFTQQSSDVDEAEQPGEAPAALALRLAVEKAQVIAARNPDCWVLGSDQVAALAQNRFGKPGTRARAIQQLKLLSGRSAQFITAVALLRDGEPAHTAVDTTVVRFRKLSAAEIERYVDAEPAFDCAGSFKCEGLGITLCESIETRDPTALIGLPLIATRALLSETGFQLP